MLTRLPAVAWLLLLAACDPTEVGPELEATIALAITGAAAVDFATATVTVRGPVTKSVTGRPGEKVEITGLTPGATPSRYGESAAVSSCGRTRRR